MLEYTIPAVNVATVGNRRESNKTKSLAEFFISYHILHLFKHISTLENITTSSSPYICIISPSKAYFDYITKPFVIFS